MQASSDGGPAVLTSTPLYSSVDCRKLCAVHQDGKRNIGQFVIQRTSDDASLPVMSAARIRGRWPAPSARGLLVALGMLGCGCQKALTICIFASMPICNQAEDSAAMHHDERKALLGNPCRHGADPSKSHAIPQFQTLTSRSRMTIKQLWPSTPSQLGHRKAPSF